MWCLGFFPHRVHVTVAGLMRTGRWPRVFITGVVPLQKSAKGFVEPIRTRVPLGSDVEAQAIVKDTDTILIKTQLGFWAECSLEEAPKFIQVHVTDLDRRIKVLDQRVASIRMHVKLTLQALGVLNQWPAQPTTA